MNSIFNQIMVSDLTSVYLFAQTGSEEGPGLIGILFGLVSYIFGSYCFMKIYDKLREPNSWFAFVPLLNCWIMYKAGDKNPWWLIGLFIPLVNIVALIILLGAFINIVNKIEKNPWLILLMIVPLVNFWVMYHFAFT